MSPLDPSSSSTPIGNSGSQPPALFFPPDAPKLLPSDPWYQMMTKLFPNVAPDEAGVYAAQFQKNVMNSINAEIARIQKKQHETSEKMKRMMLGED